MKNYDFSEGTRGPVIRRRGKTRITIRIDDDVLAWFREQADAAGGGNYQTMINDILRTAMEQSRAPVSDPNRVQANLKETLTEFREQLLGDRERGERLEKMVRRLLETSSNRSRSAQQR